MADSSSLDTCFKGGRFSAPGFRFHPTDEELVVYYLKRKICRRRLRVNAIGVVDVYRWDPEDLPGQSLLKSGDRQWFFFTPRSRKYPNAARSNRGTENGYWKATGKDRIIFYSSRAVGIKKTLVFYRGRAPNGERTDWVMHEYTMDEDELSKCHNAKEYYALYKLFKKSGAGPKNGEHYGAPFQEEEWINDDDDDDNNDEDIVNAVEAVPRTVRTGCDASVDNGVLLTDPLDLPLEDIEELLRGLADAPEVPSLQPQVNSEEDIQSTLLNASSSLGKISDSLPCTKPLNSDSHLSPIPFEATEFTSAPKTIEEDTLLVFEKEDYIEMDDLLIPDNPLNPTDEFTSLSEFDLLFHDVAMSFDMEPNTHTDPTAMDQWKPEETTSDLFDGSRYYSEAFASPSSDVCIQDQERDQATTSQFSDSLWAFMESIPSTPASACEGPLNQTFVRMSSFSRIRFTTKTNGSNVINKAAMAKTYSRNKGFLLLSILGAFSAIFWLFIAMARGSDRPFFS